MTTLRILDGASTSGSRGSARVPRTSRGPRRHPREVTHVHGTRRRCPRRAARGSRRAVASQSDPTQHRRDDGRTGGYPQRATRAHLAARAGAVHAEPAADADGRTARRRHWEQERWMHWQQLQAKQKAEQEERERGGREEEERGGRGRRRRGCEGPMENVYKVRARRHTQGESGGTEGCGRTRFTAQVHLNGDDDDDDPHGVKSYVVPRRPDGLRTSGRAALPAVPELLSYNTDDGGTVPRSPQRNARSSTV